MWRHEDIFFGAFGGGGRAATPISRPEEIAERARAGRTRCLPACPFMHGTAHWMAFTTLYSGGTVVISPDRRLDPVHVWELIGREQVNFLVIVGDAFARPLVDALDRLDRARRPLGPRRDPLGRRDPLADGEDGRSPSSSRARSSSTATDRRRPAVRARWSRPSAAPSRHARASA